MFHNKLIKQSAKLYSNRA